MPSKAVKLDEETYCRLKLLAESQRRTPHWLMREAIRQFLEREEASDRLRQETLDRWARYEATGQTVEAKTVETWLKTWGSEGEAPCPKLPA